MKAQDICVGMVLWPRPQDLTAAHGCIMRSTIPPTPHPLVCVERNEDYGLWIMLSSKRLSQDGVERRPIPSGWKIGNERWARKQSYVGEVSIIVPHVAMAHAAQLNECGYWFGQVGAEKLRQQNERDGGLSLANLAAFTGMPASEAAAMAKIKEVIERYAASLGVRISAIALEWAPLAKVAGR
jgi:hypothetical protein